MLTLKLRAMESAKVYADIFCSVLLVSFAVLVEWVNLNQKLGTTVIARIAAGNLEYMTKGDRVWTTLMNIGCRCGCHQLPERSFFIKGWQFPVCARCTGVLIGYIISAVLCLFMRPNFFISLVCCLVMLIDWSLQYYKIKVSTNPRRFITGIIGGFGVMSFYCLAVLWVIDFTKN